MRKLFPVVSVAALAACSLHRQGPGSDIKGPGVTTGSGDVDDRFYPTPIPEAEALNAALAGLAEAEPTLIGAMRSALTGERPVTAKKTAADCHRIDAPRVRVAAFYDEDERAIGLCRDFFLLAAEQRVLSLLQQLARFVVVEKAGLHGEDQDLAAAEIEAACGAWLRATSDQERHAARETLSALRQRYLRQEP